MSDSEYDSDGGEGLQSNGEVLEFGFEDEKKELGGRRLKAHKEHKRKMRPGTFGEPTPVPNRREAGAPSSSHPRQPRAADGACPSIVSLEPTFNQQAAS